MTDSVPQPFSKYDLFEKGGSVQGLGNLLYQQMAGRVSHSDNILQALGSEIVPELEQVEKLLKKKIDHIRGLTGDFDNDLASGLDRSKKSLAELQDAILDWEAKQGAVSVNKDPFVIDLVTRKHLRYSLGEENYLRESTINLERSAKELESIVVGAIKHALAQYNDSVSREAAELAVMSQKVEQNIMAGHLDTEFNFFAKKQIAKGNFIDQSTIARTLENSNYPGKDHLSTAPVCDGWLEKKSKYLNNFSTAFYIISPSRFLHEFRSNDLRVDTEPVFSLYLPECEIGVTSKETDQVHKFVLKGKQVGSGIHQEHNWTFRARNRQDMLAWYANIGRASDPAFQFHTAPLKTSDAGAARGASQHDAVSNSNPAQVKSTATLQFDSDDLDQSPFKGPETIIVSSPAVRRPAAGVFDTDGFSSPWGAVVSSLDAQPAPERRSAGSGRQATTSYGSAASSMPGTPATYPEHDAHLRQAQNFSSAANFMSKEILDDNAYLEYDKEHGTHSTLVGDEDFKPADADVTVSRTNSVNGRRSYQPRRSSSLAFQELPGSPASSSAQQVRRPRPSKVPSRKATATYGDLSNLPLPSMVEVNEAVTPEPKAEPYISPYFPAPGAGTTGALPASQFQYTTAQVEAVTVMNPVLASRTNSGTTTPNTLNQPRQPTRRMSLSDQIMLGAVEDRARPSAGQAGQTEVFRKDLEPHQAAAIGCHDDTTSPYPAAQRFRVPKSRQGSLMTAPETITEPMEAYDAAPHLRIGTQSNEARYKVGNSRRGSRTASQIATPQESLNTSEFNRSALDTLSADSLASKLNEPSQGEKARARRAPSRGASMDLADGGAGQIASPAFNVNQRHGFRKPPSRGSSMSLAGPLGGGGDTHGFLNTISEDLAAAKGNQPGDKHIPGEFPATPAVETPQNEQ